MGWLSILLDGQTPLGLPFGSVRSSPTQLAGTRQGGRGSSQCAEAPLNAAPVGCCRPLPAAPKGCCVLAEAQFPKGLRGFPAPKF